MLGGLGILVIVVVTVVATLFVTRDGDAAPNSASTPTSSTTLVNSGVASADDQRPVSLITEDPTCAAWTPIGDTLVERLPQGWKDRDSSIPSSAWTPDMRAQYEDAATAMRAAAEQTVPLVSKTPHRVMRELYEQAIAFWRDYADATNNYAPDDNYLANASTAASNSLVSICAAISSGSAASRSLLMVPTSPPIDFAPIGDPSYPQRFLESPSPACVDWAATASDFDSISAEWLRSDPNIPASQWSADQQKVYSEVAVPMTDNANSLQDIAIRSKNAVFTDFADLAATYRRAYVQSFATYVPADAYLAKTASQVVVLVNMACSAAGN
ncbi:MAG: hypothetical protein PGN37_04765 [Mycobacterium kyogaense]|uniref:hypothetical protein n=1 Tax=Mycobacterium kyogaense TaxID=2212479 RepID=UPI002FFC0EA2